MKRLTYLNRGCLPEDPSLSLWWLERLPSVVGRLQETDRPEVDEEAQAVSSPSSELENLKKEIIIFGKGTEIPI
jgi:hypothetical protein